MIIDRSETIIMSVQFLKTNRLRNNNNNKKHYYIIIFFANLDWCRIMPLFLNLLCNTFRQTTNSRLLSLLKASEEARKWITHRVLMYVILFSIYYPELLLVLKLSCVLCCCCCLIFDCWTTMMLYLGGLPLGGYMPPFIKIKQTHH